MRIKEIQKITDQEGVYNIVFHGKERIWCLTKEERNEINEFIKVNGDPKMEVYHCTNENGWYGFMNTKAIEMGEELTKFYHNQFLEL